MGFNNFGFIKKWNKVGKRFGCVMSNNGLEGEVIILIIYDNFGRRLKNIVMVIGVDIGNRDLNSVVML